MVTRHARELWPFCTRRIGPALMLGVVLCLVPRPSAAQPPDSQPPASPTPSNIGPPSRPERPSRAIFGSPAGSSSQQLTLEGSLGAGWTEFRPSDTADGTQQPVGVGTGGGESGHASTNAVYSFSGHRWGVNAADGFYADYYSQFQDRNLQTRHTATAALYFLPLRATRVTVSGEYRDQPVFSYSDFFDRDLTAVVPQNQDVGITENRFRSYASSVGVTQRLSSRSQLGASIGFVHGNAASRMKWTTVAFQGDFTQRLTRDLSLSLGYADEVQQWSDLTVHDARDHHPTMRLGVDYSKALSFARRTSLSFSTGVGGIHNRVQNQTSYHLIGGATLRREFGRTWDAGLFYSRDVQYIQALAQAVFEDSVTGRVRGSLNRRLQMTMAFGSSSGQLGASGGVSFDSVFGTAQLLIGMTRYVGISTDYSYSRFPSFGAGGGLDPSGQLNGQSARVSLQLWVPALRQSRQADASPSRSPTRD
jgi:hypothetical protein